MLESLECICEECDRVFLRPIPPSLTGRPNSSCSSFEHGGLPVSAGMKV